MAHAFSRLAKTIAKSVLAIVLLFIAVIGIEVISALVIGYPPILRFVLHERPFRGQSFSAGDWADAGSCQGLSDWECAEKQMSCPRGGMVRDLTKNHILLGQASRRDVFELLGESSYTVNINGEACAAYSLGMCSGLGLDYDSLYICFDETGAASAVGHVQH